MVRISRIISEVSRELTLSNLTLGFENFKIRNMCLFVGIFTSTYFVCSAKHRGGLHFSRHVQERNPSLNV